MNPRFLLQLQFGQIVEMKKSVIPMLDLEYQKVKSSIKLWITKFRPIVLVSCDSLKRISSWLSQL